MRTRSATEPADVVPCRLQDVAQSLAHPGVERLLVAAGYPVSTFASAEALLQSKVRHDAACLILDVRLPGLSGPGRRRRRGARWPTSTNPSRGARCWMRSAGHWPTPEE
jgi:hypothetical protein